MNLVLIGYRGTGKTSVAQEMAARLSWPVLSTDDLMCKRAGETIPEIVEHYGWDGFRDLESVIVNEVSSADSQIIDTGGGAILRPGNLDALKKNGIIIWLKATVETIQERIFGDLQRPSLTGDKTMINEVDDVLRQRIPVYNKASDYQIDTDHCPIKEICDNIMKWLETNRYIP